MKKSQKKKKFPHLFWVLFSVIFAFAFVLGTAKYIFGIKIVFFPEPIPEPLFEQNLPTEQGCTLEYEPVCGSDGKTYTNICLAKKSNITNISFGECKKTENFSCIHQEKSPVCGDDQKTYKNTCFAREAGVNIISHGECKNNSEKNEENTSQNISENIIASGSVAEFNPEKYHIYQNKHFGYSYALPNYTYYQGFGSQNGADNVMAVALSESNVQNFESGDVKIYFYKNPPKNPPTTQFLTLKNGNVLYFSASSENPKIQNILTTLKESAESK